MKKLNELLEELERYPIKGMFYFGSNEVLSKVCNIPVRKDYSGIYLFYDDKDHLIYVGISGREGINNEIIHRKDGLRGRFLTGKQFGDRRSKTLPIQMKLAGTKALQIKWFVTYCDESNDIPRSIEKKLINAYKNENLGNRPKWNKKD